MRILSHKNSAFTLIEILVSLAIVAVLSTVVVVTLNPAELLKQARDSNRISDLNTINTALGTFAADVIGGSVGASSTVYVSLPSNNSDCSDLGLPTLTGGWVYKCVTRDNLTKIDGTGWIPVNFQRISFGNPLEKLPIDQKNTTSTGLYYTFVSTGSWWELTAILESAKYGPRMVVDGGASPNAFEQGTNLTLTPTETLDRGVVANPGAPSISSVSPTTAYAGDPQFTLTVNGSNFTASTVVQWGGTDKTTTFVSSTQLTATISASDISAAGTASITVSDPTNGISGSTSFAITERTQFIAGSWTTDASGGCSQTNGAAIAEAGGIFYTLCGGGGGPFAKYNPSTKAWTTLASVPSNEGNGASIVKYDNDTLFAFRQEGSADFYKYVISTNTWSTMTSAPGTIGTGASLAYPGTGDFIYAFRGGSDTPFWRYSVSQNNWGESGVAQTYGAAIVEVVGKFYIFPGGNGSPFKKYDPSTRAWTTLASITGTNIGNGTSMVKYNNDTIYAFRQEGAAEFYKYVISTNTWSTMASAPAQIGSGAALAYPGTGDYIYAFKGNDDTFWRYSVSLNSWNEIGSGNTQTNGAAIVEAGGNFYIFLGGNGGPFRKYSPATKTWTTLTNVPSNTGNGASLVKYNSDTIYAFRQEGAADFYKYTISSNAWSTMTSSPSAIGSGASLAYPGTGDYIYALKGGWTSTFWSYSVSGNSWASLANSTDIVTGGGALTSVGSDSIYALQGGDYTGFWKYTISTNTWTAKSSVPSGVRAGGSLTSDGTNVFALRGAGWSNFWKYTVASNTWSSLNNAPANIGDGTTGSRGGLAYLSSSNKIYAISGLSSGYNNSIMEYDVASAIWPFPGTAPTTMFGGDPMVAVGSDKIFAFSGNDSTGFYKYTISTGTWSTMTSAPGGVRSGGSLTTDGTNIYATRGAGTTNFWKYTVGTNSWSSLAATPVAFGDGVAGTRGGAAYSSSSGKIFAISGNGSTYAGSIYEYSPSSDAWVFPNYAPGSVSGGGALTAKDSDTLYAFAGADNLTFWKYVISSGTWSTMANAPGGVRSGGSLTTDGTSIFATRGTGTTDFWKYAPSTNSWSSLTAAPVAIGDGTFGAKGGAAYSSSLNAVFMIPGSGTSIYKNAP